MLVIIVNLHIYIYIYLLNEALIPNVDENKNLY
jgi:hypothetical protein